MLLDATAFEKLERGYLWMVAAIVHCGHRPQHMSSQGGYLLLDAMEFEKLQRGYLWMDAAIAHCGYRPQPIKS